MSDEMQRIYVPRKPGKCPSCGAKTVAAILYGYPAFSAELDEKLQSEDIVLGGCCITDDDPKWACTHCAQRFYRSGK